MIICRSLKYPCWSELDQFYQNDLVNNPQGSLMTTLTDAAIARGDLAEQLVIFSQELAYIVGTGDQPLINFHLNTILPEHLPALVVVLAGMIDVDKSAAELLSWMDFDEHGHKQPGELRVRSQLPIAQAIHNRVVLAEALRARLNPFGKE